MNGYFDHNATSPMTAAAREEWLRVETSHWHNPSSLYREAGIAKRLLEDLREEVADRLGSDEPERVVFTSGATEANNAVMRFAARQGRGRAVISPIEHPSVGESALAEFSDVGELRLADDGAVGANELPDGEVALVSVMAANNETGGIQPWREIALRCAEMGAWYHCDAAQWIGKLDSRSLGSCDFVSGCAHKFGGPKGVGFLLLPEEVATGDGLRFSSLSGGPQENRHRAGTENLPAIAAMLAAWRERDELVSGDGFVDRRGEDRDQFESDLCARIEGCEIVAKNSERLWNTSMLIVPAHSNLKWLTRLSRRGFSISTGSACSAGKGNPSHVMEAMGLDHDQMGRVLRISGGWETTTEDWRALASAMVEVGEELDSGERPKVF